MSSIDHPKIEKMIAEAKEAAGDPKPAFGEIIQAVADEAARREGSQRALMIAGLIVAPNASEMRQIAKLDAVVRFLDACVHTPGKVAQRLNAQGKRS